MAWRQSSYCALFVCHLNAFSPPRTVCKCLSSCPHSPTGSLPASLAFQFPPLGVVFWPFAACKGKQLLRKHTPTPMRISTRMCLATALAIGCSTMTSAFLMPFPNAKGLARTQVRLGEREWWLGGILPLVCSASSFRRSLS